MPGPQPCHCIPFIFCIVGRGLDPSGGVGDAAPYNNPQGFSLPQTSAAAWGQAALHPTLLHSVAAASRHIPLPFNHPYQTKSRGEHFVRPGGLTSSES